MHSEATLSKAFDSLDLDKETFRQIGYEVIDAIADYYSDIRDKRIISESNSREIEQVFMEPVP